MNLTKEDIARIAKLARIRLDEDEQALYGQEITNILSWIEQLQEVNVEQVSLSDLIPKENMPERIDEVLDGNKKDALLQNAQKVQFDMFSVPKMVE
jgi:aspartyl-tRNA(Asn)/glutamyl-tRNA(Gln) amidotransferase subunit C